MPKFIFVAALAVLGPLPLAVSPNGAADRYTFSGTTAPFSLTAAEAKLIAPAGSIPPFEFGTPPRSSAAMDQRQSKPPVPRVVAGG